MTPMQTNAVLRQYFWERARFILVFFSFLWLTGCEEELKSGAAILIQVQTSYVYIIDLVISIAYLSGALFVVKAIFEFKVYGEQRTMMSSNHPIRIPMTYLFTGFGLLFVPKLVSILSNSMFANPNVALLSYRSLSGDPPFWEALEGPVYGLIQVVGLISVVRALFIASNPHPSGGQGGLAKAAIHLFAGIAALNIDSLVKILETMTQP